MKASVLIGTVLLLPSLMHAQDAPFVEANRIWLNGQDTTVELENEGFEAGLGSFYNTGIVNWATTGTQAAQGSMSAYSHIVIGVLDAILALDITVPSARTATISFITRTETTLGPDSVNDTRLDFLVDGVPISYDLIDTSWTERSYFMTEGNHLLNWKVYHSHPGSDDQINVFLDSVVIRYYDRPVLRMLDGSEGFGKILMSDAYGNATWSFLNGPGQFDNGEVSIYVPLYLNALHEHDIPLLIRNGNASGVQSSTNGMYGFEAFDNPTGYFAFNNSETGFYASANQFGCRSDSSETGFLANGADHGFLSQGAHPAGFRASASSGDGFYALANAGDGFYAFSNGDDGLYARSNDFNGAVADSNSGDGFRAINNTGDGFYTYENDSVGFYAQLNNNGFFAEENAEGFRAISGVSKAIYNSGGFHALANGGNGFFATGCDLDGIYAVSSTSNAGYFSGDVTVTGPCSKGGGSFRIDHPLDPENKYLYHSFVESPDMMNVYDGIAVLDENGEAVVQMAEWFEALNRDFRYLLTCVGDFAPVYIAEEVQGNQFKIAGGTPGMKVSWQVTGIRQDPYANHNRIQVEVEKPAKFKGYYLHPEAYGRGFEEGFDYVKLGYKTIEELMGEYQRE